MIIVNIADQELTLINYDICNDRYNVYHLNFLNRRSIKFGFDTMEAWDHVNKLNEMQYLSDYIFKVIKDPRINSSKVVSSAIKKSFKSYLKKNELIT